MAISNRDRVGKMFELLAPALDDFIARSVAPKLPEGTSWTVLVADEGQEEGRRRARSTTASIRRCSCGC